MHNWSTIKGLLSESLSLLHSDKGTKQADGVASTLSDVPVDVVLILSSSIGKSSGFPIIPHFRATSAVNLQNYKYIYKLNLATMDIVQST